VVTYDLARTTRDHFQDQLLDEHPEIVSLAPRLKLDDSGQPTHEAYVLVGIRALPQPPDNWHPMPHVFELQAHDEHGQPVHDVMVEFRVEEEGPFHFGTPAQGPGGAVDFLATAAAVVVRPCHGGCTITHASDTSGTLGGLVKVNSSWAYVLSCNHVLTGFQQGSVGDPIYQPVFATSGPSTLIANLSRWVPLDSTPHVYNETDAALARVLSPWDSFVLRDVQSVGTPAATADPVSNQPVRVRGMESGYQEGTVDVPDVTMRFWYQGNEIRFQNIFRFGKQLSTGHWESITTGGDSGALVWDETALTVLGLHFGGTPKYSYAAKILRTLELLGQAATGINSGGQLFTFPSAVVELF